MDNAARLKKMHRLAKAYLTKHPNASYKTAQKKAGAEIRGGAKVSGRKHRGKTKGHKKAVGTKPRYKVVHEVRQIGTMSDVNQHKREAKKILDSQLAWLLLSIKQEKKPSVKKQLRKKEAELSRAIKALS